MRVWDHSDDVWAQQFVFSRRRDARLQLLHGLRSGQRRNADRLDQPDHLTRRPADGQLHHAENARPDLYGIAASAEPVRCHALNGKVRLGSKAEKLDLSTSSGATKSPATSIIPGLLTIATDLGRAPTPIGRLRAIEENPMTLF